MKARFETTRGATVNLERDGFFSSQAEGLRLRTREMQPFKAWFDYALGLNRLGYEMLRSWGTLTKPRKNCSECKLRPRS